MKGKILRVVGLLVLLVLATVVAVGVSAEQDTPMVGMVGRKSEVYTAGDEECCGHSSPGNPYSCWCGGVEGNCVWWAYFKRPETVHWVGGQICPGYWDSYAIEEGLPVGTIPLDQALATWDWTRVNEDCAHVAYVESASSYPPNEYTTFNVTEMNCGIHDCDQPATYPADGGSNTHFIYKTAGTHLLMQLFPTEVWPPPPIYSTDQLQFGLDIQNYGEVGACPEFHFLFTSPFGNEARLRTDGCSYSFAAGQWAYALFTVHDWIPNCTQAGWWVLEQVSYRIPGDSREFPLIPRCLDTGCVEQEVTFCVLAPEDGGGQGVSILSDEECPSQYLYPTPTPQPTATSQPTDTPVPLPTATPTSEPAYFVDGFVTGPAGPSEPISEVQVCASGRCAATDGSGHYRIGGLSAGTHTVTPSKQGYTFGPPDKQVTLPPDAEQVNFVGTPYDCCYFISGYVTGPEGYGSGISGVEVCVSGYSCVTTDANGFYRKEGLPAGTYIVTPFKSGYTFGPPDKEVSVPPSVEQVNFTGTLVPTQTPVATPMEPSATATPLPTATGITTPSPVPTATPPEETPTPTNTPIATPARPTATPEGPTAVKVTSFSARDTILHWLSELLRILETLLSW